MFWDVSVETMQMLEKFVKTLSHENDGYIFSPATDVSVVTSIYLLLTVLVCVAVCRGSVHGHSQVEAS